MVEQVPIHEVEDGEAVLCMSRLLAPLILLGRQCFASPHRSGLSCLGDRRYVSAYDFSQCVHHTLFEPLVKMSGARVCSCLRVRIGGRNRRLRAW